MSVIGIGVDAVDIERFRRSLQRTPSMRERLFTPLELEYVAPKADPMPSLAARFADANQNAGRHRHAQFARDTQRF